VNGDTRSKLLSLKKRLKELKRVAVAFSGGVDSALLGYVANEVMPGQTFLFTIWSPLLSKRDRDEIFSFAERFCIPLIRIPADETESEDFCMNHAERCYICKSLRIKALERYANEWHIPWVLDGSNQDDLCDYRPGMRALREAKRTVSPLLEAGLTKREIRALSDEYGLPTAKKPAAACLASRIPTGVRISRDLLEAADRGEDVLRRYLPYEAQLRLRFDGKTAKIETDREFIPSLSLYLTSIRTELSGIGIADVEIDPEGYRMGSVTFRQK